MKSYLIQDTTKEEREQIVRDSLAYSEIGCEDTSSGYDFYQPYIDGQVELRDLNMSYRAHYVLGNNEQENPRTSCMMGGF